MLRCSGMRGAGAAAAGQPRCRGGAGRAWEQGSSSSSGAEQRRARPAAAGWIAGPSVSEPAHGSSQEALWGLQLRPAWSFAHDVPGAFLPSPHTCRIKPSLIMAGMAVSALNPQPLLKGTQ